MAIIFGEAGIVAAGLSVGWRPFLIVAHAVFYLGSVGVFFSFVSPIRRLKAVRNLMLAQFGGGACFGVSGMLLSHRQLRGAEVLVVAGIALEFILPWWLLRGFRGGPRNLGG